jgi:hypothetical protein
MPAIRPERISNCIRLANEVRTKVAGLIAEGGTVDSFLSPPGSLVDAVINEFSPHKEGVSGFGAEDEFGSRADEQFSFSPKWALGVCAVVPLIEVQAIKVAILRYPPIRAHHLTGLIFSTSPR